MPHVYYSDNNPIFPSLSSNVVQYDLLSDKLPSDFNLTVLVQIT